VARTAAVRIREAGPADATGIAEVKVTTWRGAYRGIVPDAVLEGLSVEEVRREWLPGLSRHDPAVSHFVAEEPGGRIVGFATCGPRRAGPEAYAGELYAIYVLAEAQGSGLGRALVRAVARRLAERGMRSMLLWVFAENAAGRRFYERLGGKVVDEAGFELGGRWLREVAYGWEDTAPLLAPGGRRRT